MKQTTTEKGALKKGRKEAACLEGGMPSVHVAGKLLSLILVSSQSLYQIGTLIFRCWTRKEALAIGAVHNYFE